MGIQIFRRGKEFYDDLENEITRAQKEVLINVYSFQNDTIGKRLAGILKKKLADGVAVRIILDGLGSRHDGREIARTLAKYGAGIRVFRPRRNYLRDHLFTFFRRDHARIFLIDRKLLGIGGICIGRIYSERQDIAAFVPVANAQPIISYFNSLWKLAEEENRGDAALKSFQQPPWVTPTIQALISTPVKNEQTIYRWAIEHIQSAKERIVVVSAWFLPTSELIQALCDAKERGVEITIVTPSHTDKRWYDDFRGGAISKLLKKNIAWYGTGEYFHQKYFFIDNDWCFGSANFDMISMNRNYELNLCGHGGDILRELQTNFRALVGSGEPIRHAKVNWLVRLLEKVAYPLFEIFIVTRR